MSEDRELLLLAAKAAGLDGDYVTNGCDDRGQSCGIRLKHNINHIWNPKEEDDDALRLAVKLNMRIYVYCGQGDDYSVAASDERKRVSEKQNHNGDPYAATRLAIVRAAAEIGKAMP